MVYSSKIVGKWGAAVATEFWHVFSGLSFGPQDRRVVGLALVRCEPPKTVVIWVRNLS